MTDIRDEVAAALPNVMDAETSAYVMGPDVDRLDAVEEWFMSPREMADQLLSALAARGLTVVREGEDDALLQEALDALESMPLSALGHAVETRRRLRARLTRQPEGQ